jgi:3-oxoacyl-[acyl-carrier protein] reductase
MKVLRGKKALVTGAASGIGRAIALALAREGVDLYLVDIDDLKIDPVAREARAHGVEVRTVHCDLARPEEITALVENVLRGWGRLNILVNNAGVAHRGPTHEMSSDEWNRLLAVNLMAPIQLVRQFPFCGRTRRTFSTSAASSASWARARRLPIRPASSL